MKKQLLFLITLLLILSITLPGCSGREKNQDGRENPSKTADSTDVEHNSVAEAPEPVEIQNTEQDIDVDLTVLSATMIYAEVQNMMISPDQFLGKTVKMNGKYNPLYYDVTDSNYHYIVIPDATACCAQGLEFIWSGEHTYPNDYPNDQTDIEIIGVFSSYEELGNVYYYIKTDAIDILV